MRVKICGITSLDDALYACEAGADALGFNFAAEAKPKHRYIDPEAAQRIIEQLPPFVSAVAVVVNETADRVREYLTITHTVQLHGEETPDFVRAFAARAIKAFRAGPGYTVDSMLAFDSASYLLDAYVPGARGGTGQTCDWQIAARAARVGKPLILAGGLTADNVAEAVRQVRPFAVDTAGGVEAEPGKKDHAKVRDFIRHAKEALPVS